MKEFNSVGKEVGGNDGDKCCYPMRLVSTINGQQDYQQGRLPDEHVYPVVGADRMQAED